MAFVRSPRKRSITKDELPSSSPPSHCVIEVRGRERNSASKLPKNQTRRHLCTYLPTWAIRTGNGKFKDLLRINKRRFYRQQQHRRRRWVRRKNVRETGYWIRSVITIITTYTMSRRRLRRVTDATERRRRWPDDECFSLGFWSCDPHKTSSSSLLLCS